MSKLHSPDTVTTHRSAFRRLRGVIGDKVLDTITGKEVDQFRAHLAEEGRSGHTIDMYIRTLRSSFNTARKWKYLTNNPFAQAKFMNEELPEPRVLSDAERVSILEVARLRYPEEAQAYEFLLHTGLRRGELLRLAWEDVDFERNVIRVTGVRKGSTRGKRARAVPLLPRSREILEARRRRPKPFDYNPDTLSNRFKRCAIEAGCAEVSLHDLRRTFVSHLLVRGVPRDLVDKIVGHTSFSVTDDYYFGLTDDMLKRLSSLDLMRFNN